MDLATKDKPMDITLHYLFDPLCGWCYGAAPALSALAGEPGIAVEPTRSTRPDQPVATRLNLFFPRKTR